ncbi:alpha/beta fold hydrolase [Anaerobacterium chartisolvens]|uniref:alpha/beta fold hydrolase n=1 Tax=Anaerobacterium chartisolvens TaxID=1297424 RepID=UPI001FA8ACF0|nr:alpha/beta fold hydrolase [Anaerobacterium chartisolvens]
MDLKGTYFMNYEKYFGKKVMEFSQREMTEDWLDSAHGEIHLDVFTKDVEAPTIVFSHGMAGYGRLLCPYAYRLFSNGFNVILPDLIGYGHNKGQRGHWKWSDLVKNLIDTSNYAANKFNGDIFLAGGSMGGVIAYHAVCHGAPVKAVACYCLFDFQDMELIKESSSYGPFTSLVKSSLRWISKVAPNFSIPASSVSSYDNLSDNDEFNNLVKKDPLGGNKMTLTAASEMTSVLLPISFEEFDIVPILVIQPGADKMTPAKFTKKAYEKLGTKNKKYLELEGRGHWVLDDEGVDTICNEINEWFLKA